MGEGGGGAPPHTHTPVICFFIQLGPAKRNPLFTFVGKKHSLFLGLATSTCPTVSLGLEVHHLFIYFERQKKLFIVFIVLSVALLLVIIVVLNNIVVVVSCFAFLI